MQKGKKLLVNPVGGTFHFILSHFPFHTFTLSLAHFHLHTFALSLSHFHTFTFTLSHFPFHTFTFTLLYFEGAKTEETAGAGQPCGGQRESSSTMATGGNSEEGNFTFVICDTDTDILDILFFYL